MSKFLAKLKEVSFSVIPVTVMVLILHFTVIPMETTLVFRFLIGAALIILGLTFFLMGVDSSITPIGSITGSTVSKSNKIWAVIISGLLLGFFICIAEPDLHILAGQVHSITAGSIAKSSIVLIVSLGIAAMLALGLVRIIRDVPLQRILLILYGIIFALGLFVPPEFLAIAFDASGAATGATTVPFILALAAGVSSLKKDRESADKERFGLVAITFAGPTIAIMLMSILSKVDRVTGVLPIAAVESSSVLDPFIAMLPSIAREALIAILPILVVFLVFQVVAFKLPKASVKNILSGMLLTFIGLVMFLLGANAGFMEVGNAVGYNIALLDNKGLLILIGFIIGVVTVLAEPAAYVLVDEVEQVTNGNLKRSVVLFTLSLGVGAAVSLSMVRILIPQVQLWHYLLPGYIISLAMTYFVPELFSGIAFDSGAVVSGPMTATFILAFAHGVADAVEHASLLVDGFGIVAMVAMTPIIALQILGFIYNRKSNVEKPITEQELSTEQEPISITFEADI